MSSTSAYLDQEGIQGETCPVCMCERLCSLSVHINFFQIAKDLKKPISVEELPLPSHMHFILVRIGTHDLSNQNCSLSPGVKSVVYAGL